MTVNIKIKRYLEDNGIKQTFLQKHLNMGLSTLNALLNDNRRVTADEYFKICNALNLPLDYFATDTAATVKSKQ